MVVFNSSKTQFLHLSMQQNLNYSYMFFENTQLNALNIISVSFSLDLNWKDYINSFSKSVSKRLDVLGHFKKIFIPSQLLALYWYVLRSFMEHSSYTWGNSTHNTFLYKAESKALQLVNWFSICWNFPSLSLCFYYHNGHCFSLAFWGEVLGLGFPCNLILSLPTSLILGLTCIPLTGYGTLSYHIFFQHHLSWAFSNGVWWGHVRLIYVFFFFLISVIFYRSLVFAQLRRQKNAYIHNDTFIYLVPSEENVQGRR